MSLHYELVIAVHLRGDLADADLAEVRWHLGIGPNPDEAHLRDGPLFVPALVGPLRPGACSFGDSWLMTPSTNS